MFEIYSDYQGPVLNYSCTQSSGKISNLPCVEYQTLNVPPRTLLPHEFRAAKEIDPQPLPDKPLNSSYTPELPRLNSYSSTPSHSGSNLVENEHATTTTGGLFKIRALTKESRWNDYDRCWSKNFQNTEHQDPEKVYCGNAEPMPRRKSTLKSDHTMITYTNHQDSIECSHAQDHSLWILIYLSLLSPVLTLAISLYTILLSLILLILSPISACSSFAPLSTYLHTFLFPPLRIQLGLIDSTKVNIENTNLVINSTTIIFVHIFAPVFALGIALSAWVAAVFWAYAAILGDPDGQDGNDDGKAAVLCVRAWWEQWLLRGIRCEH